MKFNHTAHKALWNWLAETGEDSRSKWPEWKENGGEHEAIASGCFACEYSNFRGKCPLANRCNGFIADCLGGLYLNWRTCDKVEGRKHWANIIANLPVKEGVECE